MNTTRDDQGLVAVDLHGETHQGARVVNHGRYLAFQMAEIAISRHLFVGILQPIAELRPPPEVVIRSM